MTTIVRTKIKEGVLITNPFNKKTLIKGVRIGAVEEQGTHTKTTTKKMIYLIWVTI
jgi:hypothetical protein